MGGHGVAEDHPGCCRVDEPERRNAACRQVDQPAEGSGVQTDDEKSPEQNLAGLLGEEQTDRPIPFMLSERHESAGAMLAERDGRSSRVTPGFLAVRVKELFTFTLRAFSRRFYPE